MKFILVAALIATPALAQDAQRRPLAALPFILEQRNNALDGVALCQGDLAAAQAQLAELQKQLADAKATIEKLKPAETQP